MAESVDPLKKSTKSEFEQICGSYDHSGSRFYPHFGSGFWILVVRKFGSWISTFPGNLTSSLLCAGCHAVEKILSTVMAMMKEAVKFTEVCYCSVLSRMALPISLLFFSRICRILLTHKYFVDSHPQS